MRLNFYKRSAEKFVSRFIPKPFYSGIDPEVKRKRILQGLGRIPRRLRRTRRNSNKDTSLHVARSFIS